MLMHIRRNKSRFYLKIETYLKRKILLHNTIIASHSLLNNKVKLGQLMRLHTKEIMSCFPQRKSKAHGIRTEQRHEHLTEEEKKISAQIRSVAATLYEKNDLDKPTVEFLREHFYKDPTLALTYFYCCATDPRGAIFIDELQPDVDTSVVWNRISNLIGSPIGQEEAMGFAKRHSATLTNHMSGLLHVHLVVNAF
jgi:hypothetical protein